MEDFLRRLLAFVASHDMIAPRIEGDAVVFGVEAVWPDGKVDIIWERVTTVREARNALGY